MRTTALPCLLALLLTFPSAAEDFHGVTFSPPAGWATAEQGGKLVLAPADADEETMVVVVLDGAAKLGSVTLAKWLEQQMAANLNPQAKVLQTGEVTTQKIGGLDTLTTARTVQDAEGNVRLQMFHAVSDGKQATLAMGVATSEAAFHRYLAPLQGLFESLRVGSAAATATGPARSPAATPAPSSPQSAAPAPAARGGEPLPEAGVVNGRPQGLFVGVSVLSGNPVFLLFLPGGRVYHNLPRGGLNRIDWNALQAENPDACGRWDMAGTTLRIQWADGNVWQGPLQLTDTGIFFQGKRYGRAYAVRPAEMAGSWEGTHSTAWLNLGSGPATTQVNELTVDAAGNYLFGSAMGSSVEGAASYGESSTRGQLTVEGYDAVFHGADGRVQRMSLIRLRDGGGVILDGTFFQRR
ncbi:MAG TPA: hypothetical protein VNK82_11035 [Terriglobales bacterium]|nr:hypothetical protein [Terriglobales bacterium]